LIARLVGGAIKPNHKIHNNRRKKEKEPGDTFKVLSSKESRLPIITNVDGGNRMKNRMHAGQAWLARKCMHPILECLIHWSCE
jgi:uncharacterized membrane protein